MDLKLYIMEHCPYCRKVMNFIEKTGRTDVQIMDIISDAGNEETLIRVGGKRQVPCLFIDGKPLYESLDIIKWLEENPQ